MTKIRGSTSRRNIRYQVREYTRGTGKGAREQDRSIEVVKEFVGQMRIKYPAPAKIIVYSGIKAQADILGEELGYIVYYANISHQEEKEKRLGR